MLAKELRVFPSPLAPMLQTCSCYGRDGFCRSTSQKRHRASTSIQIRRTAGKEVTEILLMDKTDSL